MPQKRTALGIIRDEHLAIASVLYSLRALVRQILGGAPPDFGLLHAMLDYIVVFPERLHHPKEDGVLFAALRERCADALPLLDALMAEHVEGARQIEALNACLAEFEADPSRAGAFAAAVEAYAAFHWRHMTREEEKVLPLAERHLSAEDWARVAEAFRANDNPLFGIKPRDQAELLYQKILALGPASGSGRERLA